MRLCTAEPVIQHCDAEVGRSLDDFLSSVSPRICQPGYTYTTRQTSTGARVFYRSFDTYTLLPFITYLTILT